MATFIVDGKAHKLEMRDDNNIDWSADFIGGYEHGMEQDEDGNFVTDQAEYDWWVKAFADQDKIKELVAQYQKRYGEEEVNNWLQVSGAYETDLDMMLASVRNALQDLDA